MTAVTSSPTDPLSVFLRNALTHDKVPVPLQSTAFDITIEAGLALVLTTRLFRNSEDKTIEATLTFPVPVHAVLFSLEVRIGERRLQATAKAKETARETYEEGIEEGKTSILHEELLRGIHMLSVGNIPPGEEIEVKTIWAMPLMIAGGEGHLRIPTTVGQIYGQSPLADGDDFSWGGEVPVANVVVKSPGSPVKIGGRLVGVETIQIRMNQPIDLALGDWQPTPLLSRAADGAELKLELFPAPASSAALSLAILVDHSGSMEDGVSQGEAGISTVHGLVLSALKVLSAQLTNADFIDIWEFSNSARHVGHSTGNQPPLHSLIRKLSPPGGGTDINTSLSSVLASTEANSVLLITDGRSHDLDIQALARRGKRVSVLLVGEDSLEAQVGHLAVLTGGDIFVAPKDAVDRVLESALNSLRSAPSAVLMGGLGVNPSQEYSVSGMMIRLTSTGKADPAARSILERGIAALSASLQLPRLSEKDAAALAVSEGLVTHLTSLVLVDDSETVQESIPTRRRIPLASPAAFSIASHRQVLSNVVARSQSSRVYLRTSESWSLPSRIYKYFKSFIGEGEAEGVFRANIDALADIIDWDSLGDVLAKCEIELLEEELSIDIRRLSESTEAKRLSQETAIDPVRIAILLLARRAALKGDRSSSRVLKSLRKDLSSDDFDFIVVKAAPYWT